MTLTKSSDITPQQLARTHALSDDLRAQMTQHGPMNFAEFMAACLYHPEFGYYTSQNDIIGQQGDFITAPELTPAFGVTLAQSLAGILTHLKHADIVEVGAGNGALAASLLPKLAELDALPRYYNIVDISPTLRQRQAETLSLLPAELYQRIRWLDSIPTDLEGIILTNELLDALPVHIYHWQQQQLLELGVIWDGQQFIWTTLDPADIMVNIAHHGRHCERSEAIQEIKKLEKNSLDCFATLAMTSLERTTARRHPIPENIKAIAQNLPDDYWIEDHRESIAWITHAASCLKKGVILCFDYGYEQKEYYHPQRNRGTLRSFHRHMIGNNPLSYPGLQDLTCHVNFTEIQKTAIASGLLVSGYTTQANFLLAAGLQFPEGLSVEAQYTMAQAFKKLLLPSEMGELIKVIALTRNFDKPILGF